MVRRENQPESDRRMESIKNDATIRLLEYLMVISCVAFPASLYRTYKAGLADLPHVLLHAIMFLGISLLFCYRRQLNYRYIVGTFVACSVLVSVTEFTRYGLVGVGEMASMFAVLLCLFYLNWLVTALVALTVSVFFFIGQYLFVKQGMILVGGSDAYMANSMSWLNVYTNAVGFFIVIGIGTRHFHNTMMRLNQDLESTNEQIQQQKERIEFLANHDALTGLPSLRVANDRVDEAIQFAKDNQHHCGLLFLDLDGFKYINDTHGHEAGDYVLKAVAERIHTALRADDTVCRIGGDEFLVVVHYLETYQGLEQLCVRLNKVIKAPVNYKGKELVVGSSIGASGYPCCAEDAAGLRLKADELMYKVKKTGKGDYLIAPELNVTRTPRVSCTA